MKKIWIFLAHPDDEFFIHSFIARTAKEGHRIYCAYTTDGGGYGADPLRRLQESRAALHEVGVSSESFFDLGVRLKIPDGMSYRHLNALYENCLVLMGDQGIDEVIVPAWEGGHVDHDAALSTTEAGCLRVSFESSSCFRTDSPQSSALWPPPKAGGIFGR